MSRLGGWGAKRSGLEVAYLSSFYLKSSFYDRASFRNIALSIVSHFHGGVTYRELWSEWAISEVLEVFEGLE